MVFRPLESFWFTFIGEASKKVFWPFLFGSLFLKAMRLKPSLKKTLGTEKDEC
jgi:hypothetical protein